ncbi:hypothetical protein DMB66_52290 [Actinoplanes sp. ATCC 53533]|uniref:hypothetical protein n=1 Tax=Actinoplanes sp. ATCC 53533 TaxID=1288362 RepID=UPI000F785A72|nr:hypothetical protein [Actinoplanes sp. ATCC 53533]RSM44504.1 hypothetical protein DMB66_52290 [Actinoplanes sp. ATCC 53533]
MSTQVWLDPPTPGRRRAARRIEIRLGRWFATVELNRDDYVDHARSQGRDDDVEISPEFKEALERCADAACDHLWVSGYPGGFIGGTGPHFVTLPVPFAFADEACEALRAAEMDGDVTGLDALTTKLAVPLDRWLAPGERQLRRGIDFSGPPSSMLKFLRYRADARGLRLNGRAVPGAVWVSPVMPPARRHLRAEFPEQFAHWADPALYAEHQDPDDEPFRPYVGGRDRDQHTAPEPVQFLDAQADDRRDKSCSCGFYDPWDDSNTARHAQAHMRWATGVSVPRNVHWYGGKIAVVATTSPTVWRKLAYQAALLPKRENHYDFASFGVGVGEPVDNNLRAYLYRDEASRHVVGFVSVWDSPCNQWHPFDDSDRNTPVSRDVLRPVVNVIFTAQLWRRRRVAQQMVDAVARHAGITTTDVAWSPPFSTGGRALAQSLSPAGVWVPANPTPEEAKP